MIDNVTQVQPKMATETLIHLFKYCKNEKQLLRNIITPHFIVNSGYLANFTIEVVYNRVYNFLHKRR